MSCGQVMAIIADFMLVYLPAPTVSLRPPLALDAGRLAKFFYSCPDNAFQVSSLKLLLLHYCCNLNSFVKSWLKSCVQIALPGTSFSLLQRIGAMVVRRSLSHLVK